MNNYDKTIAMLLQEVRQIAKGLPTGQAHKIYNRCDKLSLALRKASTSSSMFEEEDLESINRREKSNEKIYQALLEGRHLSQMDCREFRIEDMRTPISHMKDRIYEGGHELCSRWIKTPTGRSIKEYWVESLNN